MPISVEWRLEKHIIDTRLTGIVTTEELLQAATRTVALVKEGAPLVHDLIDMRAMTNFPTRLNELAQLTPLLKEGRSGWLLIVTEQPMARFIASTLSQVAMLRLRLFATPEDALAFIYDMDTTLPPAE
jgi:hypothetical protein